MITSLETQDNNHDPPKPVPGHPDKIIKDHLKTQWTPPTPYNTTIQILPSISDGELRYANDGQDDR